MCRELTDEEILVQQVIVGDNRFSVNLLTDKAAIEFARALFEAARVEQTQSR